MFLANLPFQLGCTYGGTYGSATSAASTDGAYLEGSEYLIPDVDLSNRPKLRSNRLRRIRVVRNSTGAAVKPSLVCSVKAGTIAAQVDSYTDVAAEQGFVADEYLPAAGAAANELFYVVIDGPALLSTNGAADATGTIPAGAAVVASTANGSTNVTMAGRVAVADFATAATGAALAAVFRGVLGRALSTMSSASTNSAILVDVIRTAL